MYLNIVNVIRSYYGLIVLMSSTRMEGDFRAIKNVPKPQRPQAKGFGTPI